MRVALASTHAPESALLTLRDDERPFALIGQWAGGGAILGSEPVAVADPAADPFVLLDEQPGVEPGEGSAVGGGWFGSLGYGLGALVEPVPPSPPRPVPVAPFSLAFYDHVLRRDETGQWWFEALWSPAAEHRLARRLEILLSRLAAPAPEPELYRCEAFGVRPTRAGHIAAVRACREAIRTGELYQANLTLRLEAAFEGAAIDLFARCVESLRPRYAAFVADGDRQLASLSPELFLARHGREVRTEPIKGTAARRDEDTSADGLLASEKDRAENVMIVDLMRNDLGRVCEYASVRVADLARAEAHPGVWHLVSEVRGRLASGATDADLVRASFPPGSVTGAPKVKAMEVIARLESTAREAYTGAIGYASPIAGLELNVAIRTFEIARGKIWLGAGGGIVADSDPAAEYRESLDKARPLVRAAGGSLPTAGDEGEGSVAVPSPTLHARPDPALGILETLALVDGRLLELDRHLERLGASARQLYGLEAEAVIASLEGNAREEAAARPAGVHRVRLVLRPSPGSPEVEVLPIDPTHVFPERSVELHPVTVPGGLGPHKWLDRRLVRDAVSGRSGAEALLVDLDGTALETGNGNLFVVENGSLLTPRADGRILAGITRSVVMEELGAREAPIGLEHVLAADELFVTSAVRGVQPARVAGARGPATTSPAATEAASALAARWRLPTG